jgi:pre-mRNA-splicing helicase BRR2
MDTVTYDGDNDRFVDLKVSDIWQMVGAAGHEESPGKCVILCHSSRKERLKTFLHDLIPLESQLDHNLHDFLNAEVVSRTITSKTDAVDFLTWTFYYRRLAQNPNYYNLSGGGHQQLSDHLSDLIETVLADLEESKCLGVEDDMDLIPLNLGMIAAFYSISYITVELFSSSITNKSKTRAITEILSAAQEVSHNLRLGEIQVLQALAKELRMDFAAGWEHLSTEVKMKKALLLLQAHFNRTAVTVELRVDQLKILKQGIVLAQALVDVISSQGWLKPALAAMEVSQCIVQGVKPSDPTLLQIPHFTVDLVSKLKQLHPPVETVFDLLDMDDIRREQALAFSSAQLSEIAMFCNAYPSMQITYNTSFERDVASGSSISVTVSCNRDTTDESTVAFDPTVVSGQYPFMKKEAWWVIVGDDSSNVLYAIKRFVANVEFKASLEFNAPEIPGDYTLRLYVICDSYVGCDQEYELPLVVTAK